MWQVLVGAAVMKKVLDYVRESQVNGSLFLQRAEKPAKNYNQDDWVKGKYDNKVNVPTPSEKQHAATLALYEQVSAVLSKHYRFIGQIPRRSVFAKQVKVIVAYYRTLNKLGFEIRDVTSFGLRHAKVLLQAWQTTCAPSTVYVRWSALRFWTRALEKHGMLGSIKELQPEFVRSAQTTTGIRVLTIQEAQVRSDYLSEKSDYLVDRLTRELGLTREEALLLSLDSLNAVLDDKSSRLRVGFGLQRRVAVINPSHVPFMVQIRDFMVSRNRKTLAWSNLDPDAALQKYALRLSYVTRTLFPQAKRGGNPASGEGGAA